VSQIPAEHSWVTNNHGNNCSYLGYPYINNCNYDSAGELLKFFYGNLQPRVPTQPSNIFNFSQSLYTPLQVPASTLSFADLGYIYVPKACQSGATCKLHIFFHGCKQGIQNSSDAKIYLLTGFNEWAESNNVIVVYPQVVSSSFVPFNPQGCWDWWGYTGLSYAVKIGPQIWTIDNMIVALTGQK